MKLTLFIFAFLVKVICGDDAPTIHYHLYIGIQEADRIQAVEAENQLHESRIVGGLPSYYGEHKFAAGLIITLTTGQISVCGASLLNAGRLITAAHCWYDGVYQAYEFEVVLGSIKLFSGGTRISTRSVTYHEHFNPNTLLNDLAIIEVPTVTMTRGIQPISLPDLKSINNTFVGAYSLIIGYGKTSDSESITFGQSLRDASVYVITNAECRYNYGSTITDAHICTSGANYRGPCGGDSGGPLRTRIDGDVTLIGIISFGSSLGCRAGRPSGYTRITSHLDWIKARL